MLSRWIFISTGEVVVFNIFDRLKIYSQVTFGYVSKLYYVTVVCSSVCRLRRSNSVKSTSGEAFVVSGNCGIVTWA